MAKAISSKVMAATDRSTPNSGHPYNVHHGAVPRWAAPEILKHGEDQVLNGPTPQAIDIYSFG